MRKADNISKIGGTDLEDRWMLGNFTIGSFHDVLDKTGFLVKGMFLYPQPTRDVLKEKNAVYILEERIKNEVVWGGAQPLGTAAISPFSGHLLLKQYNKECPIEARKLYHWKVLDPERVGRIEPNPCTREEDIITALQQSYMELIKTDCYEDDLLKYANSWSEPRKLA